METTQYKAAPSGLLRKAENTALTVATVSTVIIGAAFLAGVMVGVVVPYLAALYAKDNLAHAKNLLRTKS